MFPLHARIKMDLSAALLSGPKVTQILPMYSLGTLQFDSLAETVGQRLDRIAQQLSGAGGCHTQIAPVKVVPGFAPCEYAGETNKIPEPLHGS